MPKPERSLQSYGEDLWIRASSIIDYRVEKDWYFFIPIQDAKTKFEISRRHGSFVRDKVLPGKEVVENLEFAKGATSGGKVQMDWPKKIKSTYNVGANQKVVIEPSVSIVPNDPRSFDADTGQDSEILATFDLHNTVDMDSNHYEFQIDMSGVLIGAVLLGTRRMLSTRNSMIVSMLFGGRLKKLFQNRWVVTFSATYVGSGPTTSYVDSLSMGFHIDITSVYRAFKFDLPDQLPPQNFMRRRRSVEVLSESSTSTCSGSSFESCVCDEKPCIC